MDIFPPIQQFANRVTYVLLGLPPDSYVAEAVNFFIYDLIKISLMLLLINYVMAVVRYYLPMERVRQVLTRRRWYGLDYLLAALLGVVTPFCSCSSIPLFMGFVSVGIPLGVTTTFLIASPLVNEASLFLFPALFGWKVTLLYNVAGIVISMMGGMLISRLRMEKYIEPEFASMGAVVVTDKAETSSHIPLLTLLILWAKEAWDFSRKIFPYVVLGVGLGALIHGFVPESFITTYLAIDSWWVVPLAVLLGTPLYANSVTVIPIVQALVGKGIPIGTALAFMTAVVTLSLPEALMLKKVMKWPLLLTFFGISVVGIMFIGYLFNWLS